MKALYSFKVFLVISLVLCITLCTAAVTLAQTPVPSRWKGVIEGKVHNKSFRLPVVLEIKPSMAHENNPFHLFIGSGDNDDIGYLYIISAMMFNTSSGRATLQYFTMTQRGNVLEGTLTNTHKSAAAKANGFTGPNVSAAEASDLMRDILKDAWGDSEMFGFSRGVTIKIQFNGNKLSGAVSGSGTSYTATSSSVQYQARFQAERVQ